MSFSKLDFINRVLTKFIFFILSNSSMVYYINFSPKSTFESLNKTGYCVIFQNFPELSISKHEAKCLCDYFKSDCVKFFDGHIFGACLLHKIQGWSAF